MEKEEKKESLFYKYFIEETDNFNYNFIDRKFNKKLYKDIKKTK